MTEYPYPPADYPKDLPEDPPLAACVAAHPASVVGRMFVGER
jgi:hypothetical protein